MLINDKSVYKAGLWRVCGLDPPFSITTDLQCTYIDLILVLHPLLAGAVNRLVASVSVDSVISCVLPGQRRNKSVLIYNPILPTNYMYNIKKLLQCMCMMIILITCSVSKNLAFLRCFFNFHVIF